MSHKDSRTYTTGHQKGIRKIRRPDVNSLYSVSLHQKAVNSGNVRVRNQHLLGRAQTTYAGYFSSFGD